MLKKEFKRSDIQRVRNLVLGDYDAKTKTSVGYTGETVVRKEGDVWEEHNKMWTIKNGIKISVNKHKLAKQFTQVPITCPQCDKRMKSTVDKKMWKMHGVCMDCMSKLEQDLKSIGRWEEYEKAIIHNNINGFIGDLKLFINDVVEENTQFVSEDGKVEDWSQHHEQIKNDVLQRLDQYISHVYTLYDIDGSTTT